ncbi:MAG: ribosomal protein S18 acetylase RimI-like enzyme [Myxococcota bacterium]|jgi:ribosomal protein S18 acetylase RimI-like enzyme
MIPLIPHDRPRLLTLLRTRIEVNVFLLSVLHRAGNRPDTLTTDGVFYGSPTSGALKAVVYATPGGLMVPFALAPEPVAAIGRELRGRTAGRILVGPRAEVDALWSALALPTVPRIRRAHRLYRLQAGMLTLPADPDVRPARPRDLETCIDFAARMQGEELGIDPRSVDERRFRRRINGLVADELLYVLPVGDTNGFQASASSYCPDGTQVEAVFTPPWLRGRGWATRGLTGMCDLLLQRFPTVTLHVNEANHAAVRLYERIGFEEAAPFRLVSA